MPEGRKFAVRLRLLVRAGKLYSSSFNIMPVKTKLEQ